MNICIVIDKFYPLFTGQGKQIEHVWRELHRTGLRVIVITRAIKGRPNFEVYGPFRIYRIKRNWQSKIDIMYELNVFKFLWSKNNMIDIVHFYGVPRGILGGLIYAKLFQKKTILESVLFGTDDALAVKRYRKLGRFLFWLYSQMDCYITLSTPLSCSYLKSGLSKEKLYQIPQGVDIKKFCPVKTKLALRRKLQIPFKEKILCFVGSILHRKGIDILIDAYCNMISNYPNTRLLLVGKLPSRGNQRTFVEDMKNRIRRVGIEKRVNFLGEKDNVHQYLQVSDIFVLPSRQEGFPSVIIEAMSCGLPCIVTEINGISNDIIDTGVDGIIVKDNASDELKTAMEYILCNAVLAKNLGKNARQKVLQKFSIARKAKNYLTIYSKLLKNNDK